MSKTNRKIQFLYKKNVYDYTNHIFKIYYHKTRHTFKLKFKKIVKKKDYYLKIKFKPHTKIRLNNSLLNQIKIK